MIVKYIGGGAAIVAGLAKAEDFILKNLFPQGLEGTALKLPRLYGLVIVSNLAVSTITMMVLGMRVGKARREFKELAEKEENVDPKIFELPNLYASGDSELAKGFNCVQRGHQQALETYTSFLGLSLIGGIRHPVITSMAGILWSISRLKWSTG